MSRDVPLSGEQLRLTAPWAGLVAGCRYRLAGPFMRAVLRVLHASAVTLNGVAYVHPAAWRDDVGTAALIVHEAVHARDQRIVGWWPWIIGYLAYRLAHPREDIRLHPDEAPCYALADEVGRYWYDRSRAPP